MGVIALLKGSFQRNTAWTFKNMERMLSILVPSLKVAVPRKCRRNHGVRLDANISIRHASETR